MKVIEKKKYVTDNIDVLFFGKSLKSSCFKSYSSEYHKRANGDAVINGVRIHTR